LRMTKTEEVEGLGKSRVLYVGILNQPIDLIFTLYMYVLWESFLGGFAPPRGGRFPIQVE